VNRGTGALGDKLFVATLDAHVIALDSATGNLIWDVGAADYRQGYSFTVAPLVVKDKVIVGVSGGEFGVRGFIDAYNAETGKRAWRFYTIPGPGEPGNETWSGDSWKRGGGPAWVTGTYDADLNLVYWGIGNPAPDYNGKAREGDNLYTESVVALDADTGKLKWYFQFTPHDLHDYDSTQIPLLLDLDFGGQHRKLLAQANRNGFFYLLDRSTGKFLLAKPFTRITWAKEIGADGRPVVLPVGIPSPEGVPVCPGAAGGTNYMSPSYSPQTGLVYLAIRDQCDTISATSQRYRMGGLYMGSTNVPMEAHHGSLGAIDASTGELKWEFKYSSAPWGGALSTAGGLVFASDTQGNLIAFDAQTGKDLWHFQTGSPIYTSPVAYALDGKQYIVVPSGAAVFAFALPESALAGKVPE
jgi:alcohol dehydrogenase (cytochrome c)